MINSNAKIAIGKRTQKSGQTKKEDYFPKKNQAQRNQPITYRGMVRRRKCIRNLKRKTGLRRRRKIWSLLTNEKKLLELKYTKAPAAYRSLKKLEKSTFLKPSRVKVFLEGKNAHIKHKKYRKSPTLKVIAYGINEIWSLNLAQVNKSKDNRDIKILLVAVDCLSCYLRVKPLKSNYATTTANAFKKRFEKKTSDLKKCG